MKRIVIFLLLLCTSCAPLMKYEPPKIEPIPKIEPYILPADPFKDVEPPKPLFLAKSADGGWKEVSKDQGEIIAYFPKEHDKIVLRLQYYKDLVPSLVKLINVYIEVGNGRIQLQIDERVAKELYKQNWIDTENKRIVDQRWNTLEKTGLWAIILGQLAAIIGGL